MTACRMITSSCLDLSWPDAMKTNPPTLQMFVPSVGTKGISTAASSVEQEHCIHRADTPRVHSHAGVALKIATMPALLIVFSRVKSWSDNLQRLPQSPIEGGCQLQTRSNETVQHSAGLSQSATVSIGAGTLMVIIILWLALLVRHRSPVEKTVCNAERLTTSDASTASTFLQPPTLHVDPTLSAKRTRQSICLARYRGRCSRHGQPGQESRFPAEYRQILCGKHDRFHACRLPYTYSLRGLTLSPQRDLL